MRHKSLIFILLLALSLSSCTKYIYPDLMFRQSDYRFFELRDQAISSYMINTGDEFTLQVLSRDGLKLIDVTDRENNSSNNNNNNQQDRGVHYIVEENGFVKLPVLGDVYVLGLTERELEDKLQDMYGSIFNDPFVMVTVTNRRAYVFKGSAAQVVPLNRNPTNLLEVIAKSGGLTPNSKAYKIKVIRGDYDHPQMFLIDLSTLKGLSQADMIIQNNDIIYVEEKRRVISAISHEVLPITSFLTALISFFITIKALNK